MSKNKGRYFQNGTRFLFNGERKEAERAFILSISKDKDRRAQGYLWYLYLLYSDMRALNKAIRRPIFPVEGFDWYVLYWRNRLVGEDAEAENCLYRMLESGHYFLRAFALKILAERKSLMKRSIEDMRFSSGLVYDLPVEEIRAGIYLDLYQKRDFLALTQIKNAVEDYPLISDFYLDLLDVLQKLDKTKIIRELIRDSVFLNHAERDDRVKTSLARVLYRQGRYQEAKQWLKRLIRQYPLNAVFHFNLANVYFSLEDLSAAVREYKKTIYLSPVFERAYYNLGTLYLKQGYIREGLLFLKEAVRLKRNPDSLHNLSYCLIESKQLEEAYHYLNRLKTIPGSMVSEMHSIKARIREAMIVT